MNQTSKQNGYWERENSNPVVACFMLLFILGITYIFIQSILVNGFILIDQVINKTIVSTSQLNWLESMQYVLKRYKIPILIIIVISQYVIFLGLTFIIFKKWHGKKIKQYFYFDHFNWLSIFLSVLGTLFFLPLAEFVSRFFYYFFPELHKLNEFSLPLFETNSIHELLLMIFFIGVTPAICEETIFRGYFQRTLQRKLKEPWHYLLAGFIFALFHQQPLALPALSLAGIWLGFLFYRYQSIYASMAAHFVYNSLIILLINVKKLQELFTANGEIKNEIVIGALVLFIITLLLIYFSTRAPGNRDNDC